MMDRFERDFENLDVRTSTMERTMDGATVLSVPKPNVDALIAEAAGKTGIELSHELPSSVFPTLPWDANLCQPVIVT
ncbi:unnamed protein product [Heligmosomoides polygyrus]|uniref:FAD-binding oxidoreductase n=1 Tax=Heligmosomoides polygyrus TaxID=6339 RepID=A0A183GHI2_HELPZ|nr:unnamed protein product [Heligmosomoides polygyrus]